MSQRTQRPDVFDAQFDYIVLGGGSAGCIMAARLSENPQNRVLLVEAGKDYVADRLPENVRDPGMRTVFAFEYYWPDYFVEVTAGRSPDQAGREGIALLARALGGGSLVNGMHSGRGMPRDYEEWRSLGVIGWSAEDVLPFFKRLESDHDFPGEEHGTDGPIEIQRVRETDWSRLSLALRTALERRGVPRVTDFNSAATGDGVGPVPLCFGSDGRQATVNTYLTAAVRRRPNFAMITEMQADRLIVNSGRVVAAELSGTAGARIVRGANIIVSCGALHSPALLQRSGIGTGTDLRSWDIPVVADRPGVGRNLQNHPILSINAHLRPEGRCTGRARPPCLMIGRYSSNEPGCQPTDMYINFWERSLGSLRHDPLGRQIADCMLQLNKSYSVGKVAIDPGNPRGRPRVQFNMLGDPRDRARMVAGFRFVIGLLRDPAAAPLVNQIFIPLLTPKTLSVLVDTPAAQRRSTLAAIALSGPDFLRRYLLKGSVIPVEDILEDEEAVDRVVFENSMPAAHSVGTCRMGDPRSKDAVTDSRGRVIGVEGLRVVDGSIFPTIMTAGTNLPIMMAAEKIAAMTIEDRRVGANTPTVVA